MMRILLNYGTRPEYIKIAPLIKAFSNRIESRILCTGQHKSLLEIELNRKVDFSLNIPEPETGENRLDLIFSSIIKSCASALEGITHVLVPVSYTHLTLPTIYSV